MNEDQKAELLKKYTDGTATPQEQAVVESWQLQFPLEGRGVLGDQQTREDLAEIRTYLLRISGKRSTPLLWYKISAAAVLAFIAFSTAWYFHFREGTVSGSVAALAVHDIAPGKNAATLTLADGSRIVLDERQKGRLARQGGISISKDAHGRIIYNSNTDASPAFSVKDWYNILSTAKGEQYQVKLPDGTHVWLNSASALKYAPSFAGKAERKVELTGEAYFEVAKDKLHPFIVRARGQEVSVLGTHFNINSYTDEPVVRTTLLEGSVGINHKTVLKPGQESLWSENGVISVQPADTEVALAWKNGSFIFKDVPLDRVMRQISRWYDLEIVYNGELTGDTFNGVIDRKANLSRILKIIEKGGVRFKVEGKKLIVTP